MTSPESDQTQGLSKKQKGLVITFSIVGAALVVSLVVILVILLKPKDDSAGNTSEAPPNPPSPPPSPNNNPNSGLILYGWDGLAAASAGDSVIFTYSFVPSNVIVSDAGLAQFGPTDPNTLTVNMNSLTSSYACQSFSTENEIAASFDWWLTCLFETTGVNVSFQFVGTEKAHPYTATHFGNISKSEKQSANIGDIRVCA